MIDKNSLVCFAVPVLKYHSRFLDLARFSSLIPLITKDNHLDGSHGIAMPVPKAEPA